MKYDKSIDKEGFGCAVMEQIESSEGLFDSICDQKAEFAGLCNKHYVEYLVALIRDNNCDPVEIFEINQLEQMLLRNDLELPSCGAKSSSYQKRLIESIKQKLAL